MAFRLFCGYGFLNLFHILELAEVALGVCKLFSHQPDICQVNGLQVVCYMLVLFCREDFHAPAPSAGKGRFPGLKIPRFGREGLLLLLFVAMGFSRDIDGPFLPQLVMEVMDNSKDALLWTGWINGLCALGGMLSGLLLGYAAGRLPLLKVLGAVIFTAGTARILLAFAPSAPVIMGERFVQVLAGGGGEFPFIDEERR